MAIEATPITPASGEGAYLSVPEARALAATLPLMATLLAESDDSLGMLLLLASVDIDHAMRYQGCKLLPTQPREFPRLPYGRETGRTCVWDWDATNDAAVVPDAVLIACLFQASWLLDPKHAKRLEAIRSGLAAQSIGSGSETYLNPSAMPDLAMGLSGRASKLMERYRIKSGASL